MAFKTDEGSSEASLLDGFLRSILVSLVQQIDVVGKSGHFIISRHGIHIQSLTRKVCSVVAAI